MSLAERLTGLGFALEDAQLHQADRILVSHGITHHAQVPDIVLLSLVVEAYRDPRRALREIA